MDYSISDIKSKINTINTINNKISHYENFFYNFIKFEENATDFDLLLVNTNSVQSGELIYDGNYQIKKTDVNTLNWLNKALEIIITKTNNKVNFIEEIIKNNPEIYQYEKETETYRLSKKGTKLFSTPENELEINYYNLNLLSILFQLKDTYLNDLPDQATIKNILLSQATEYCDEIDKISYRLSNIEWFIYFKCSLLEVEEKLKFSYQIQSMTKTYLQEEMIVNRNNKHQVELMLKIIYYWYQTDQKVLLLVRKLILNDNVKILNYSHKKDRWELTKLGIRVFNNITDLDFMLNQKILAIKS